MIVQTNDSSYGRDTTSKALLNTNSKAKEDYLARKRQANRLDKLEGDVREMNDNIFAIRQLLEQISR